jgi:predicted ATPase
VPWFVIFRWAGEIRQIPALVKVDELVRLRGLLSASRLVTIAGPGGAGKTRLAEELARGLTRSFGEVAAAYLASAVEATDVSEVVAAAVGLQNRGERPVQVQLVEYLGQRRLLLLLDNCEHVVEGAASLAADLLANCRSRRRCDSAPRSGRSASKIALRA